jgi:hypothetical protein
MFYNDSETIYGKSYPDGVVKWWQSKTMQIGEEIGAMYSCYQLKCRISNLARTDVM